MENLHTKKEPSVRCVLFHPPSGRRGMGLCDVRYMPHEKKTRVIKEIKEGGKVYESKKQSATGPGQWTFRGTAYWKRRQWSHLTPLQ